MSERKRKFKVGEVVCIPTGRYGEITCAWEEAEGVGRGLRWHYKVKLSDYHDAYRYTESELRLLTNKQARRVTYTPGTEGFGPSASYAKRLEALLPALEQQISALQKVRVRERELLALADKWEKASFGAYRSIELSRRYAKDLRAALGPEGEKR